MNSRMVIRMIGAAAGVLAVEVAQKALQNSKLSGRNRDAIMMAIRAAVPTGISIVVWLLSDDQLASNSQDHGKSEAA